MKKILLVLLVFCSSEVFAQKSQSVIVSDEGTSLGPAYLINFVGSSVSCGISAGQATCTFTAPSVTITNGSTATSGCTEGALFRSASSLVDCGAGLTWTTPGAAGGLNTAQTWNAGGTTFVGHNYVVTDTASASGSLHSRWRGEAAGTTDLMTLSKGGKLAALTGVDLTGVAAGGSTVTSGIEMQSATQMFVNVNGTTAMKITGGTVRANQGKLAIGGSGIEVYLLGSPNELQLGFDANGSATNQTLKAHDGITGTNISGANLTIAAGRGTGTGAGGTLIFQTAPVGSTGTTAQTLATVLTLGKDKSATFTGAPVYASAVPAVSNTSANSCGTTAATIAGTNETGIITVGATAGTSCTVTFTTAAPTRRQCTVNNETTANLARSTYSSTTISIFAGTFVAGDVISYNCDVY